MASSWYSWLPGLPSLNFTLPSGVQSRFISFALKKSLGHFLKPGQLDSHQIDSQIGSGYIQVNDLELNTDAINELLHGLPLELHDGFIGSITGRIPWPNPLTSTIGFSLDALHLTFFIQPPNPDMHTGGINLSESVTSIADSFLHEALSPGEGDTLWKSFHQDLDSSVALEREVVPGGLDPFLAAPEDDATRSETDPTGVSLVATLIERLLSRFECDAVDTRITLVHPGNLSVTTTISEIRYHTNIAPDTGEGVGNPGGQTRTISISGVKVVACNLQELVQSSSSPTPTIPARGTHSSPSYPTPGVDSPPPSPTSSSSSLDGPTQLAMSQSLAFLPPRPVSPASSLASSMYQSALSISHEEAVEELRSIQDGPPALGQSGSSNSSSKITPPILEPPSQSKALSTHREEVMLSFGNTPIVISLTTPSPSDSRAKHGGLDVLSVSVTMGIVACIIRAWQIRGVLRIMEAWSAHLPDPSLGESTATSGGLHTPLMLRLDAVCNIRGVVVLVFPRAEFSSEALEAQGASLTEFFSRPIIPPQLPHGYVRLHFEGISVNLALITDLPDVANLPGARKRTKSTNESSNPSMSLTLTLSLGDLSLFVFHKNVTTTTTSEIDLLASPLLITDHNLPLQYSPVHIHPDMKKFGEIPHLPAFNILDWTDKRYWAGGAKLSAWRVDFRHSHLNASRVSPQYARSPPNERDNVARAAILSFKKHIPGAPNCQEEDELHIHIVPLHIFVDLGMVLGDGGMLDFLQESFGSQAGVNESQAISDDSYPGNGGSDTGGDTPPASPAHQRTRERENERKRLERLVLQDLDLELDYREKKKPIPQQSRKPATRKHRVKPAPQPLKFVVEFSMIRIEARCPPPASKEPRSGALVFDLHDVRATIGPQPVKPSIRFAPIGSAPEMPPRHEAAGHELVGVEIGRILVASSLNGERSANSIISLGPIGALDGSRKDSDDLGVHSPLKPRIIVSKSPPHASIIAPGLVLSIDIPSVHVDASKPDVDGLQYWVDDLAQAVEQAFGEKNSEKFDSKDSSLIGSRFFMKSQAGSGSSSTAGSGTPSETIVKLVISEAFIRIVLSRSAKSSGYRTFTISASDLDILLELKPEGKDQTVVTLGVMDATINTTLFPGPSQTFLSLTAARSLTSVPKPLVKLRFVSLVIPGTTVKESRIKLTLTGFTYNFYPDIGWISDLTLFVKPPPGAFEAVIPSERTVLSLKLSEGSVRAFAPSHPGAVVLYIGDMEFSTEIIGNAPESLFCVSMPAISLLAVDDARECANTGDTSVRPGVPFWKGSGYALVAEVEDLDMNIKTNNLSNPPDVQVVIDRIGVRIHLAADTLAAVTSFASDLGSAFKPPVDQRPRKPKRGPSMVSEQPTDLMASVEDLAFKRMPEVGPAPDMIFDDLPTNLDYLDESFGTAAGLRELRDDDLDEFDTEDTEDLPPQLGNTSTANIVSKVGGETIRLLRPEGIHIVENYFENLAPDAKDGAPELAETSFRLRLHHSDITLHLYDGYDWAKTRRTIEEEVKDMRRRLAKIRQLVASGQTQDPNSEETSALLFNSVYIGLEQDIDTLEPSALIAAIDQELKDDVETASQSSWQSLRPTTSGKPHTRSPRIHGKRLTRSKTSGIEFRLMGLAAEIDKYRPDDPVLARTFATVKTLEILDHIKTSTWKKFLTELRSDSHGNVRETDSNMVRIELLSVRPVPGHPSEESRLRAKILPLRLYVDQDALDFLKKFFSFKDPNAAPPTEADSEAEDDIYFQLAEIFPIDLKLDYKPRRVDYRALRDGKTIELMNFFHFDGAEMTLRHIILTGITGWPRLFDLLNDLWTPDVKATQLMEVISGVAPIRSIVNVGSGVADLVLLPIAQYKKDGRIVRGVQKGTTAFVKSTAIEAIKLGARLATGTQVILEQAEGVLGGEFKDAVTAETVQVPAQGEEFTQNMEYHDEGGDSDSDLISKYAQQPMDIKEGMQSAYKSLQRNFNSAAQTILAVPMEVYERSGNEGPVRSVIRAVPIAVLKPMIGASEAVSKTLLGLHNTLDPNVRHDNEAKYKHR
ncbi:hypothetical protein BD779DRAFT_1610102 [Infundibulicybe gibba]|nr:hypothetical protein BD779DRAFT_1610102 [Infundibulicybe gibba]